MKSELLIFPDGTHEVQRAGVTCSRSHNMAGTSTRVFAPQDRHLPTTPCVLRFKKARAAGLTRVAEGGQDREMASPWHLSAPSWRAAAKATLPFLPGRRPGQLGMRALGKAEAASLKKAPPRTWSDRAWGHGVATEGVATASVYSCLLASARELSRWQGWFSCQLLGAFKRTIAVHWLSKAPPTSSPEQVRAVRLWAEWGVNKPWQPAGSPLLHSPGPGFLPLPPFPPPTLGTTWE